jgi:hypothetical protein
MKILISLCFEEGDGPPVPMLIDCQDGTTVPLDAEHARVHIAFQEFTVSEDSGTAVGSSPVAPAESS